MKQHGAHETLFPAEAKPEEIRAWVNVYRANALAFPNYRPNGKKLRCAIDLFCTEVSLSALGDSLPETWGWEEHTQAGVNVIPVPGAHVTMMKEPHVRTLAGHMKNRLQGQNPRKATPPRAC
ncbi:MAG: hypothetical protein NTX45_00440 [Proteobacteria bacterium]|nr:hypothetical protein [Pseudomonadota bacterium]